MNPLEANAMPPSFEILSESTQVRGRIDWKRHTLRRTWTHLLRRFSGVFNVSKACADAVGKEVPMLAG
jgi:hypothetical protein